MRPIGKKSSWWLWKTMSCNVAKMPKPTSVIQLFPKTKVPTQGTESTTFQIQKSSKTKKLSVETLMEGNWCVVTKKKEF